MRDVASILQKCVTQPPNILATLQSIQNELGYVPPESVPKISAALGVTDSDVAGVLSFYHDLRTEPPGRHVVRFCLGESCLAMNCEKTLSALEKAAGCRLGETAKDGSFTLEKVYCLGNCALSPSMLINDDLHGRCTPETLPGMLKEYR
jgi:NADH:ubiquinone oxidoreductase subunit E